MKIVNEFKEFAVKGNMIDMAVGIIIGAAFGKIVSSLVDDILMPPLGYILGGVDFKDLKLQIKEATIEAGVEIAPAVTFNYGSFIQAAIDFLIIAIAVFLLIKAINRIKLKNAQNEQIVEEKPNNQEALLTEIRDLLKNKS